MIDNQIIIEFIEWWKKGGREKLDGEQIAIVACFYDWLKEREAYPPDLGISVSETIRVKDIPR